MDSEDIIYISHVDESRDDACQDMNLTSDAAVCSDVDTREISNSFSSEWMRTYTFAYQVQLLS